MEAAVPATQTGTMLTGARTVEVSSKDKGTSHKASMGDCAAQNIVVGFGPVIKEALAAHVTQRKECTPISLEIPEQSDGRSEGNEISKPDGSKAERQIEDEVVEIMGAAQATMTPGPGETSTPHSASAVSATSRMICLRSLRVTNVVLPPYQTSSLENWGALGGCPGKVAVGALTDGEEVETNAGLGLAPPTVTIVAGGSESGISGGVPLAPNKIVDLRQVKKVRPGPLARGPATASASSADEAPTFIESEGSEGSDIGAGAVKVDLSAGKRMIEFQLKQNAAEERREATRLRKEKERACAAVEKESQRMLAHINARIEAQRRGAFAVLGNETEADYEDNSELGGPKGVHGITEEHVRKLSEKHGILVKFVDDGDASGVAQIRALARAHGIRIKILNKSSKADCVGDGAARGVDVNDEVEEGAKPAPPGDVLTPPPTLPSLRSRVTVAANTSSLPKSGVKALSGKTPNAPTSTGTPVEGGMFCGPARMMRKALQASGGCVPSPKDVISPVAKERVITTSSTSAVSSWRKATSTSAVAASNALDAGSESVSGDKGSVANGRVSATPAGRKRRHPTGDPLEVGEGKKALGGGCVDSEGGGPKDAKAMSDIIASDVDNSGCVKETRRRGLEERLGGRSSGSRKGESASNSAQDIAVKMRAMPGANNALKRMRLVSPDGVVVSQSNSPVAPATRSSRRATLGSVPWTPGNNLFKGAMAGITGRGKRPSPWRSGV